MPELGNCLQGILTPPCRNFRKPKGCAGSKALCCSWLSGRQLRLLFRDEIPLFAPKNLCYCMNASSAVPPWPPAHFHWLLPMAQPPPASLPTARSIAVTALLPITGPNGCGSLNHLHFALPGISGREQSKGVTGLGQEERGRVWREGSKPSSWSVMRFLQGWSREEQFQLCWVRG